MSIMEFVLRYLTVTSFSGTMKHMEYITKTYFSGESLLFIYWSNVSIEFRLELMDYWLRSEIVTVETCNCDHVTNGIIWDHSYVRNTVVLFGDMVPERRLIENLRQCRSWNARSKILTIVDNNDIVHITLGNVWAFTKAINVTVMASTLPSIKYYTLYPYEKFKIVELERNRLFPSKPLNNLHGSVISVATTKSEPYVLTPAIPNKYTEGIELRMINTMRKKFNFKIEFVSPPKGQSAWITLSKGKAVGYFGLLQRCEADIVFHGLQIRNDRCSLADVTTIHTMDHVMWIVPVRPYSFNWKSLVIVFQSDLWVLLFSTSILITITLYVITKYEFGSRKISYNVYDVFFQTFGIHLGAPIYFYRERQLYRLFIFVVSYYALIIVALYQSSLITYLTTPGSQDQYHTIEEAIDDGLIGYFFPSGKSGQNATDHDLWNKILRPGRHEYLEDGYKILGYVGKNKTVYALLNRNFVNFQIYKYLLDDDHEPMVRMLPDIYKNYMVAMFTSRGHPLNDIISNELLRLNQAGILEHWMEEILINNLGVRDNAASSENDDGPMALSIAHLKGVFYIIPLMDIIAVAVFIGEVVYYWWTIKRNRRIFELIKI